MKLISSHGRPDTCDYFSTTAVMDYITLGYNFRISNITAALGIAQLNKVNTIIDKRRKLAEYYSRRLKNEVPECFVPKVLPEYYHVYQLFSILAKKRDLLMKHLEERGIMTKIYFPPVHETQFYKKQLKYKCKLPNTSAISAEIVSLPFYPSIAKSDIDLVIDTIKEFYMVS